MHRIPKSLVPLVAILLLSAPAATATWYFAQSFEPSTSYDTDDFIWQDAPPAGSDRIYFAAETHYLFAAGPYVNPNVGALHTRIEVTNAEHHGALLGVWKDCNGDGYIGMLETAVREYSAELLASTAVCPPVTGPTNSWTAGAHNYNGWVSELVTIGRDGAAAADRRMYMDNDTRVWGDFHRPDEKPWHSFCPISPQPRGTYQSTGGLINYFDCRVDIVGLANLGFGAVGDPLGLSFADRDDARTGPLGQVETFGDENDSRRAVTVWDCSEQTRVGDELNKTALGPLAPTTVHNLRVAKADPSVDNTDDPLRRVAATANHTAEGVMVAGGEARDCDTSNDFGHDVYTGTCGVFVYCVGESDFNPINPKDKRQAHFNMRFNTAARGAALSGSAGIPTDGGLRWPGSHWSGTSYWLSKPGPATIRTHFQDPTNSNVEPAPAHWTTWYAFVPPAITGMGFELPGGDGEYGSWHCPGGYTTTNSDRGFQCNASLWNFNPDGTPYQPGGELEYEELVAPGQPYNLRDVDCYDGGIGNTGVGIQPAYYGPDPCA